MIAVVGGGPGGLALALLLARRGLPVRVYEKRHWPVDKTCGEGLMPTGLAVLRRLGLRPRGYPFTGVCYRIEGGGPVAAADFREGPGLGIRRTELSQALAEACRAAGVELREGVTARWLGPGRLEVEGQVERAELIVGADGLHSGLRRAAGLQGPRPTGPGRWGMRAHFAVRPWSPRVEVHVTHGCEAYVTPVGEDEVGVAVLTTRPLEGDYFAYLARFPELRARLPGPPLGKVMALGPLAQNVLSPVGPGLVLVGDAAGYLDACTGEGLSLALAQAEIVAAHYRPGRPLGLATRWAYARLLGPYKLTTHASLFLHRHPRLRNVAIRLLARQPWLFRRLLSFNMGHF